MDHDHPNYRDTNRHSSDEHSKTHQLYQYENLNDILSSEVHFNEYYHSEYFFETSSEENEINTVPPVIVGKNDPTLSSNIIANTSWRVKDKIRTSAALLVVCLNIGQDPPDIAKPEDCSRKECWKDPELPKNIGLEKIGNLLQQQYEKLQNKIKYKQCLDPTIDDLRKTCSTFKRNASYERFLFHYNGHGVPRPTRNGEIW